MARRLWKKVCVADLDIWKRLVSAERGLRDVLEYRLVIQDICLGGFRDFRKLFPRKLAILCVCLFDLFHASAPFSLQPGLIH